MACLPQLTHCLGTGSCPNHNLCCPVRHLDRPNALRIRLRSRGHVVLSFRVEAGGIVRGTSMTIEPVGSCCSLFYGFCTWHRPWPAQPCYQQNKILYLTIPQAASRTPDFAHQTCCACCYATFKALLAAANLRAMARQGLAAKSRSTITRPADDFLDKMASFAAVVAQTLLHRLFLPVDT